MKNYITIEEKSDVDNFYRELCQLEATDREKEKLLVFAHGMVAAREINNDPKIATG